MPKTQAHARDSGGSYARIGLFRYNPAQLDAKQVGRLHVMSEFYTPERVEGLLLPIITQRSKISLRVLDWLVTNYAKKNNVVYEYSPVPGQRLLLNVYAEYKCWLRNYRRKDFDPFRRRYRIFFDSSRGSVHETTVGQLNFIYWAHRYGVLEYTRQNLDCIEKDMNASLALVKKQKEEDQRQGKKRKRHELSQPPASHCFVYKNHTITDFGDDE